MLGSANVSERATEPPDIGVSVVILALGRSGAQGPDSTNMPSAQSPSAQAASAQRPSALSPSAQGDRYARPALWIPLVRRIRQPFLGRWALPGGHPQANISLEDAARSALESTTQLTPRYLEQLYTFGDPSRSQGGLPMVSIVYWALIGATETTEFKEGDNVRWFPTTDLPPLAFDHREIIDYALTRVRNKVAYTDLATRIVGDEFTMSQLREVHEAITGTSLDPANFRRKMLASGLLEPTGRMQTTGRHRPARLYRYVAHESPHR
jgi:hypothetical protein